MTPNWSQSLSDRHTLITGGTRRGKSALLQLMSRALIARGFEGLTLIDPHGAFVRDVAEWVANTANGASCRTLHLLDPSSSNTFGLNPLEPYDSSWEACHDAALTLASVVESRFEASPEQTPRLARIIYVAGMLCARNRLTVLELVEVLSLGGDQLRRSLLHDFDNHVVRRELEDLHHLALKQPRAFLEVVESAKNRFVRWLGDRRLALILGQKNGLNLRAIMDRRELVFADFSSLAYSDAAFVGTVLTSMFFAVARRRPPLRCARHRLVLDEAESLMTVDLARMCDQSAKQGLNLVAAIQRLGQLRARGDFIADALFTNCGVKICFGGLEPDSADYMAKMLFTGFVDLEEWKPNSARPVAVGHEKKTVRGTGRSKQFSEHDMTASTYMRSHATARGSASATGSSSGFASGTADTFAQTLAPNTGLFVPLVLAELQGASNSSQRFEQTSSSSATSSVEIDTEGEAFTTAYGTTRGHGSSESESEVFTTTYEWLPSTTFTLEEQLHRFTGELINLPRRECFVKIESERPFRTRTAELAPGFRTSEFKSAMLPLFLKSSAARSPYLLPVAHVDAELAARLRTLIEPALTNNLPDPSQPEPIPVLDNPDAYARGFWQRRSQTNGATSTSAKKTPDRAPGAAAKPERFHVIDGDKSE